MSAAPAMAAPLAVATGPEETLWHGTPSWALMFGKIVYALLSAIVLPLLLLKSAHYFPDPDQYMSIGWKVIVVIVLVQCIGIAIAYARIKSIKYTVTNQRVIIESGLLSKQLEDIDLRTIDDTTFRQRFIERLLRIGNVTIISTDKVAPAFVLRGIDNPRDLRELIRSHAYQKTQGQLFTRAT